MKKKRLLTKMMAGITTLVVLSLIVLMLGSGGIPTESFPAADGRGYAMMLIDGVAGPYQANPYIDHIKVVDVHFDIDNQGTSGDLGSTTHSDAQFSEVTVVKDIDETSPTLALYCASGQYINSVEIKLMRDTIWPPPNPPGPPSPHYYIITLSGVVISKVENRVVYRDSDQLYGHLEELSFRADRIKWRDVDTSSEIEWDLDHNRAY